MTISRREFLQRLGGGISMLPLASILPGHLIGEASGKDNAARRYNVLFMPVDDLNRRLGCYGYEGIRTPNIDRLARRGVVFTNAYCQYPLCNPTRTSFLSGLRPETTGIMDNHTNPRANLENMVFMPEYFKNNDYFTARVGKIFHSGMDDGGSWYVAEDSRDKEKKKEKKERKKLGGGKKGFRMEATEGADADEPDGYTGIRVSELLEQNRDREFFIAAGFHKPHLPWVAPAKYFDLYPPERMSFPEEPQNDRGDIPEAALTGKAKNKDLSGGEKKEAIAAYHSCISFMDEQVGILLDALDRNNLWSNTVVVLLGDHGFHLGEHGGLWGKQTLFEEVSGAPLIVAAPGIAGAGKKCGAIVEFVDIFPTLLELCGLAQLRGLEGKSLVRFLNDPEASWDKAAFTTVRRGEYLGKSVRTKRFRYTEWDEGKKGKELYDHGKDPCEYENLAEDPQYAKTVSMLRDLISKQRSS